MALQFRRVDTQPNRCKIRTGTRIHRSNVIVLYMRLLLPRVVNRFWKQSLNDRFLVWFSDHFKNNRFKNFKKTIVFKTIEKRNKKRKENEKNDRFSKKWKR